MRAPPALEGAHGRRRIGDVVTEPLKRQKERAVVLIRAGHLQARARQGQAVGGKQFPRITSYNVCYTKLLREAGSVLLVR